MALSPRVDDIADVALQQRMAHAIRFLSVDAIVKATEGHQGVPLGMAEIATALYTQHLRFDASDPTWFDRDRVVLSNGHGSMLLYALQYLTGNARITLEEIKRFRELGSHCAGHPERDLQAGIEVTTGPLGQGIGNALGMAVAEAYLRARFGAELVNHRTHAFVGDGCLQEGVGQETIALAGHLKLSHLTFLWDDNLITDDGATTLSISEDVAKRFEVAGWHVQSVDGHDLAAIHQALARAHDDPRPSMIACRTTIARGIARLEGQRGGHSARLHDEDAQAMRTRYAWPHSAFEVPGDVLKAWRDIGARGRQANEAWRARLNALPTVQRQEAMRVMQGNLPTGWHDVLRREATRAAQQPQAKGGINLSSDLHDALHDTLPERMVLCADLEAPTGHKRRFDAFTSATPGGAYVHCGVREHAMGAMANGMAAHGGIVPMAVTYLAFADYERPAMRMAALMGLRSLFVFSHDSIGIGKNGPTHQPVEVLASLRAMPNMLVLRPCDAVEAAECWAIALQHRSGPVSLIFARQALPTLRPTSSIGADLSARGAYILRDANPALGARQVTLLSTGSEVAIACEAQALLERAGTACAVVSMPSWELFDQQSLAYRDQVLGASNGVRVAVEAAVRLGWDRYVRGPQGAFVGMQGFGASGPADELYRHFGITAQAVVKAALDCLASSSTQPGVV
jgi:transketolase